MNSSQDLNPVLDRVIAVHGGNPERMIAAGDASFSQGQFQAALVHFLAAIKRQPGAAEFHYRAGLAWWRLGQWESSQKQFVRAIELRPDFPHAHAEYGRVLLAAGEIDAALKHSKRAVELAPQEKEFAIALAAALEADRQSDPAGAILDRLLAAGHESTDLAMVFARIAPRRKGEAQALALIDRLLPPARNVTPREQSALQFAAAQLLDGLGRYDEAFARASTANALRGVVYDARRVEQTVQDWIDWFQPQFLKTGLAAAHGSRTPVFIVGMPRSGTSLVEQILASHPQIHGAGELNWISRIFESLVQQGFLRPGDVLSRGALSTKMNALASQYLQPLQALAPTAARITDKMPTNFFYLGFIRLLFPQAHIIHCRRDPRDTCLSCFMTDFTAGYDFSFSLASLGHYYRQYDRLMSHWKAVLDVPMLEVDYEKLVGDIEGESRRMVDFLGLPWDEKCLAFHENRRFVGTASNAQVRRPAYQSSVRRWRNYAAHLGALDLPVGP